MTFFEALPYVALYILPFVVAHYSHQYNAKMAQAEGESDHD